MRPTLLALALLAVSCGGPDDGRPMVRVAAAASLREAAAEIITAFEAEHPQVDLSLSTAASGVLRRQIEVGRAADVFLSANRRHTDALVEEGHIRASSVRVLCSNRLVVATPAGGGEPVENLADLADSRFARVAIGSPRTAPVGEAAEAALRAAGVWDRIAERLIMAENATQIAAYVRLGEVDAAVIYETDARILGDAATVALRVDPALHPPIAYTAAAVADSPHPALAEEFVELALSPAGQAILHAHGFR